MRAAASIDETADVEETPDGPGRAMPTVNRPPLPNFSAIEDSTRKPLHTTGRLSENTLKAMLQAQELG